MYNLLFRNKYIEKNIYFKYKYKIIKNNKYKKNSQNDSYACIKKYCFTQWL